MLALLEILTLYLTVLFLQVHIITRHCFSHTSFYSRVELSDSVLSELALKIDVKKVSVC